MAENVEETQGMKRVEALIRRRKWQIQELKLKRTKSQTAGKDKQGNAVLDENGNAVLVDQSVSRKRVVRKCEFPEREEADNAVKFLTSDACLDYLRLCGAELNSAVGEDADAKIEWVPIQAWYSEEDATNQHARKGMLYHVLKIRGDDGNGEGPYVTQDGCKYQEEYTFFWDVDAPPEVPKGRSGVQYELDVKRREDEDGLGGLYDCVLVKRVTVEQDVFPYDAHMELGETQVVAQMLGVSDDSDLVVDDKGTKGKSIDDKLSAFAEEHGLKLVDEAVTEEVTKDGKTEIKTLHGMVVDITKEKNADCTTSITIRNTKEEENLKSTVVAEVTARSIKTTTIDENVPAEETEDSDDKYPQVAVDETNGVVTRKTVTKTKGGVRTIQTEKTTGVPIAADAGTIVCEQTLFEHKHTTIAEAQDKATEDAPTIPQKDDKKAGSYERVQSTLRDDGKFDIQRTVTTELPVEEAVKHTTSSATSYVEDVTNKSAKSDAATHPTYTDVLPKNQIKEVQVTRTPAGRYDVRTITRTPRKIDEIFVFETDSTRRSTRTLHLRVFENLTHAEISTKKNDKNESVIANYTDGNIRINEYGLYDGQMQYYDTAEKPTGDNEGPEYGEDAWQTKLMTKTSITQFADNVWNCTEKWIEIVGYKKADLDDIYNKFVGKDMIAINPSPANRDRTEWSVRAETAHWFTYESIINGATHSNGTPYAESEFEW